MGTVVRSALGSISTAAAGKGFTWCRRNVYIKWRRICEGIQVDTFEGSDQTPAEARGKDLRASAHDRVRFHQIPFMNLKCICKQHNLKKAASTNVQWGCMFCWQGFISCLRIDSLVKVSSPIWLTSRCCGNSVDNFGETQIVRLRLYLDQLCVSFRNSQGTN